VKRLHVHVAVGDLDESVRFYSTLFGAQPSVSKSDYAKWMLDDPRVNFAISARAGEPGLEHLGVQVDSIDELEHMRARLANAEGAKTNEHATTCCYARSHKTWVDDPAGIAWETFYTFGESTTYGETAPGAPAPKTDACCGPDTKPSSKSVMAETERCGAACC
jgi:catechol 2,3-dioxygenase-like lactoylglutathione lyase family enzyme